MRSFEEHDVVNTVYRVADGAETLDFLFRRGEYADPRMTRHIQSWSGEPFSRGRQGVRLTVVRSLGEAHALLAKSVPDMVLTKPYRIADMSTMVKDILEG